MSLYSFNGRITVIKPTVWLHPGVVTIYGSNIDASSHNHHAMQLVWPQSNSLCKLNGGYLSGATIINSKIEHQLEMAEGWVLLIEPKSNLGQELFTKLMGQPFKSFNTLLFESTKQPTQTEVITRFLTPLFEELKLTKQFLVFNNSKVKDKRIQLLLTELNQCLHGDYIKPTNWRAAEVASQLALSESRFLHLFSEELGVSWRPYLLWRRIICAVQAMINSSSATDAAHLAGFSDSAHLSRTFRNNFGMTIRQAITLFNKVS
jgi:AraC-like DNA-binding protein